MSKISLSKAKRQSNELFEWEKLLSVLNFYFALFLNRFTSSQRISLLLVPWTYFFDWFSIYSFYYFSCSAFYRFNRLQYIHRCFSIMNYFQLHFENEKYVKPKTINILYWTFRYILRQKVGKIIDHRKLEESVWLNDPLETTYCS